MQRLFAPLFARAAATISGIAAAQTPRLLADFNASFGYNSSAAPSFESFGARVLTSLPLFPPQGLPESALLATDARVRTASKLLSLVRTGRPAPVRGIRAIGNRFLFISMRKLFVSDGTPAGTRELLALANAAPDGREVSQEINGSVWIAISRNPTRTEFWRMDVGVTQARFAFSLSTGNVTGRVSGFRQIPGSGRFIFAMTTSEGRGLWLSDGTGSGTRRLRNNLFPEHPIAFGARVLFVGSTSARGRRAIYETDGTAAGTKVFADPFRGNVDGVRAPIEAFGDRVVFAGFQQNDGSRLWISDGRVTRELARANTRRPSWPSYLRRLGNYVYFAAGEGTSRFPNSLWRTDGSDAGTQRIAQSYFSLSWSDGERPALHRHRHSLVFSATRGGTGEDIWAVDALGAVASPVASGCGDAQSVPSLRATPPQIGRTMRFDTLPLPRGSLAVLVLGTPKMSGTSIGGACISRIDLTQPLFVLDAWSASSGPRASRLAIPANTSLQGVDVMTQVWNLARPGARALALSNGVALRVGN